MFKIGDIVKLKADVEPGKKYGALTMHKGGMWRELSNCCFTLTSRSEDSSWFTSKGFYVSEEMIEPVFQVGDVVRMKPGLSSEIFSRLLSEEVYRELLHCEFTLTRKTNAGNWNTSTFYIVGEDMIESVKEKIKEEKNKMSRIDYIASEAIKKRTYTKGKKNSHETQQVDRIKVSCCTGCGSAVIEPAFKEHYDYLLALNDTDWHTTDLENKIESTILAMRQPILEAVAHIVAEDFDEVEHSFSCSLRKNDKGELVDTVVTTIYIGNKVRCVTCDKADFNERQGVIEACAKMLLGNFDKALAEYIKRAISVYKENCQCKYCRQFFATPAEARKHEQWHEEKRRAKAHAYYIHRKAMAEYIAEQTEKKERAEIDAEKQKIAAKMK